MPQLVKIYRFLSLIILLACLIKASTVRIMTYNLLNFEDENDRENDRGSMELLETLTTETTL